jgi:hypothetical protein
MKQTSAVIVSIVAVFLWAVPPDALAESPGGYIALKGGIYSPEAYITPNAFLGVEGKYIVAKPTLFDEDVNIDGFTVTGNLGFRF